YGSWAVLLLLKLRLDDAGLQKIFCHEYSCLTRQPVKKYEAQQESSTRRFGLAQSNDHLTSLTPRSPRNESNSRKSFSFSSSKYPSLNGSHLKTVPLGNCASFFLSAESERRS